MFSACIAGERASGQHQTADETIDQPRQPLFRTNFASDSLLSTFHKGGKGPERKTWNLQIAEEELAATCKTHTLPGTKPVSFTLKVVEHRDWRMARSDAKKRAKGLDPLAPEGPPISEARATMSGSVSLPNLMGGGSQSSLTDPNRLSRADKYYQALLKAEKARVEAKSREGWESFLTKAGRNAERAKKHGLKLERRIANGRTESDSEDESEEENEEEEDDDGDHDLKPYPGIMKVEVEVVVLHAPGAEGGSDSESEGGNGHNGTHTPSSASEKSGDGDDDKVNWQAELQALQEEYGDKQNEAESDGESLPDGLGGQTIGNVHDAYDKRTALGLGGTAFFVPEVERYAFAPSLLPPPPRAEGYLAQTGHKRLKLKPRLPLEVSRNRWRDEHPYGCPVENEFSPDFDDIRTLEEKVRRVDLYGSLTTLISHMPKPDGIRQMPEDNFEEALDKEMQNSVAWKQYIKRQRLLEIERARRAAGHHHHPGSSIEPGSLDASPKKNRSSKPPSSPKPMRLQGAPPLKLFGAQGMFEVGSMIGKSAPPCKKKSKKPKKSREAIANDDQPAEPDPIEPIKLSPFG